MADAIAFISWGMWVADCPQPDCHNARQIFPGDTAFVCDRPPDGCGRTSAIEWPADPGGEMHEVSSLPTGQQSTMVPGSPQESLPDTSGDTGHDDPIPQDDPKDDQ
jgi:hypothetical protein